MSQTSHLKSTSITNLDATPYVQNTSGEGAQGFLRVVNDYETPLAADATGSTYQILRVRSNVKLKHLYFESQAQGAGAVAERVLRGAVAAGRHEQGGERDAERGRQYREILCVELADPLDVKRPLRLGDLCSRPADELAELHLREPGGLAQPGDVPGHGLVDGDLPGGGFRAVSVLCVRVHAESVADALSPGLAARSA